MDKSMDKHFLLKCLQFYRRVLEKGRNLLALCNQHLYVLKMEQNQLLHKLATAKERINFLETEYKIVHMKRCLQKIRTCKLEFVEAKVKEKIDKFQKYFVNSSSMVIHGFQDEKPNRLFILKEKKRVLLEQIAKNKAELNKRANNKIQNSK